MIWFKYFGISAYVLCIFDVMPLKLSGKAASQWRKWPHRCNTLWYGRKQQRDTRVTFSIVARDEETGAVGIAVASRFFASGALVPYVSDRAAFASQAFINPLWGIDGLNRIPAGDAPGEILSDLVAKDQGQATRQAHKLAPAGTIAQQPGSACEPWAAHRQARGVSCAGNMLAGPDVVDAMIASFTDTAGQSLILRLMAAMEAAEDAGGDTRGRQSAALIIHEGQPYPAIDLRVDDNADPLAELRRLIDVSEERFALFRKAMPTRENPSGMLDRRPLDTAIEEKEREMAETGVTSRSFATPLPRS